MQVDVLFAPRSPCLAACRAATATRLQQTAWRVQSRLGVEFCLVRTGHLHLGPPRTTKWEEGRSLHHSHHERHMLAKGLPPPTTDGAAPRSRVRSSSGDKELSSPPSSSNMHKRLPSNGSMVLPQHLEPLPKLPPGSASHGNLVLLGELEAVEKFDARASPPKHKLEKLDAPKSPPKTEHKELLRHNCLQAIAPTPSLLEHAKPSEGKGGVLLADSKDHFASTSHLQPLENKHVDDKPS